ncbi:MAG: sulfite exporter TauE/SafE family protein [Desulfobacterales bacterium]|nr:sulfite exporter TauE/SafE family protein [Desulfobacterales bacterium]
MLEQIQNAVQLAPTQMVLCAGVVFVAGMVRGFSGFALSALFMASVALILPPIELIPICYVFEATASLIMFRGGVKDADMKIVWGLSIGCMIGVPVGLYATKVLPVETSKIVVLCIILGLAVAQLLRVSPKILTRTSGLYGSGIAAGVVTGLAHVGGMVVALYVLAREAPTGLWSSACPDLEGPVRARARSTDQNHAGVARDVSLYRYVYDLGVPAQFWSDEPTCHHPRLAARTCCHSRCAGRHCHVSSCL